MIFFEKLIKPFPYENLKIEYVKKNSCIASYYRQFSIKKIKIIKLMSLYLINFYFNIHGKLFIILNNYYTPNCNEKITLLWI